MIKQLQELLDKLSFLTENANLGGTKNSYTNYYFQKYTESLDSMNKLLQFYTDINIKLKTNKLKKDI